MNLRLKELRLSLNITQDEFAEKIGIKSKAHISALETGKRTITDRIISDVCREFNVNEDWLRNGTGEMFVEPETFSLDDFVKQKGATDFELEIMKSYFEIDPDVRKILIQHFKKTLSKSSPHDEDCACEYEDASNNEKSIEERVAEAEREYEINVLGKKPEQLDTRDKILKFKPIGKSDEEHA